MNGIYAGWIGRVISRSIAHRKPTISRATATTIFW